MDYYIKGEEKFGPLSSRAYSLGSRRSLKGLYLVALNKIKKTNPKTVLDVGAGPGDLAILLASTLKNAKIFCVDPSTYMADIAINRSKKIGIKNIYYKLGSSRNIPFKTKFDIITTTLSFHHWKKKEESINYLLNRLIKNGILMLCEFSYEKLTKIQKLVMGKHSLSKVEAKSYQFKGYTKKINIYKNIIIISFKKELKSINNKH